MAFQWVQPPSFNRRAVVKFHHTELLGPNFSASPRVKKGTAAVPTNPRQCKTILPDRPREITEDISLQGTIRNRAIARILHSTIF